MARHLSDEDLIERLKAFERLETVKELADQYGVKWHTAKNWLRLASERNLDGSAEGGPLPHSQRLKGTSTLYKTGNETGKMLEWVKTQPIELQAEDFIDSIKEALADYKGVSKPTPAPENTIDDLLNVYFDADLHMGLLSWEPETGGNYNLDIARETLLTATDDLLSATKPSKHALLLSMGDFFHSDSIENKTRKSGNVLDVDGRYNKQIKCGTLTKVDQIELALKKHETVKVVILQGNHDEHSAQWLAVSLDLRYHDNPRVEIVTSPSKFHIEEFGHSMIVGVHGEFVKPQNLSGVAASRWPEVWGRTRYRYGWTAHIHHKTKFANEGGGMVVESLQALTERDAWNAAMGFSSLRSMLAVGYHRDYGERYRNVTVPRVVS